MALCFSHAPLAAPASHTVTIDGFAFQPSIIAVNAGDAIIWRNADPVPHTATAQAAGLDSGEIAAGKSFRFIAGKKGRFGYVCALHPTMKGELEVR